MFGSYELINIIFMLICAYSLVIIAISVLKISTAVISNKKQKRIEFTQIVIKERKHCLEEYKELLSKTMNSVDQKNAKYIVEILNYYNFFLEGIKAGIFDDDFVRITYKNEMKETLLFIRSKGVFYEERYEGLLYSIEFKLRSWDKNSVPKKNKKLPGARW